MFADKFTRLWRGSIVERKRPPRPSNEEHVTCYQCHPQQDFASEALYLKHVKNCHGRG